MSKLRVLANSSGGGAARRELLSECRHSSVALSHDERALLPQLLQLKHILHDVELYCCLVQLLCREVAATVDFTLASSLSGCASFLVNHPSESATIVVVFKTLSVVCSRGESASVFDVVALLSRFLRLADVDIQESVLHVLPCMLCGSLAIESFLCSGGCGALTALMYSPRNRIVEKALHALHVLSKDLNVARELCDLGAVNLLCVNLRDGNMFVAATSAGILQNIAREKTSSPVLLRSGVVESIAPLALSNDTAAQAAAVGLLLNLHHGTEASRCALVSVLRYSVLAEALAGIPL